MTQSGQSNAGAPAHVVVIGLVTARGGSKGIPGKNLRIVAGKPLIAWTIAAACAAKRIARVLLSTDDPVIAKVGREYGAEVPFLRPAELARDDSSHISVVNHALDWLAAQDATPDYLALLQPTSPLREASDLDAAIDLAVARDADAVIGVSEMKKHPLLARRLEADGRLAEFAKTDIPYLRRQDLPRAYAINGAIYINRCFALRRDQTFYPPGALGYVMPAERAVDVDEPIDLVVAEHLLNSRRESQRGH